MRPQRILQRRFIHGGCSLGGFRSFRLCHRFVIDLFLKILCEFKAITQARRLPSTTLAREHPQFGRYCL